MVELSWQEHTLETPDLNLVWYEIGDGPTVLILNGGPGDGHAYMRAVAEPLAAHFHCVLYDQRGCGRSTLDRLDATNLHVDRFLDDIEALRRELGQDRLSLVGHSWGASLALLYSATYPERVERTALVALGPLDDDLAAVATANLQHPLPAQERTEWASLSARRRQAVLDGDEQTVRAMHAALMSLRVRSWFYSPQAAQAFLGTYLATNDHNRLVNHIVARSYRGVSLWERLGHVAAPLLVLYGYQDFEPITQAYLLRERLPQVQVALLNECGHLPWLEQPEAFFAQLHEFLAT